MVRWQRIVLGGLIVVVLAVAGVAVVARANQDTAVAESTTTTSAPSTSTSTSSTTTCTTGAPTTTTSPTTTTTTVPAIGWPALPTDGVARAVQTGSGVVLAVVKLNADGSVVARAPCGGQVTVRGTPISGATVVLDP